MSQIIGKNFDPKLYLVLDPTIMRNHSVERVLEAAIRGGVSMVQVREKHCSNEEFISLAIRAAKVTHTLGIPLIVNDRIDVALTVNASGVHLGQSDVNWREARRLMGREAIIGLSVETVEQAVNVGKAEVDYLGVSSVFPTLTKPDIRTVWGLEGLRALRQVSNHKLVAIGGIDQSNAREVVVAGADGIAVVSAICTAQNPKLTAKNLRRIFLKNPDQPDEGSL